MSDEITARFSMKRSEFLRSVVTAGIATGLSTVAGDAFYA